MDELVKAIGVNLVRLRRDAGLSQAALARAAGVGKATLSQLEAGQRNPTLETLYALANALGTTLGALLTRDGACSSEVIRANAEPEVRGVAVVGRLLDRILLARSVFELYFIDIKLGRAQESEGHAGYVLERLALTRGSAKVGPISAPVEIGAGDFTLYEATGPHIYQALGDEDAQGLLIMHHQL